MRLRGFILNLVILTVSFASVYGVATIKEDSKGLIVSKSEADATRPPEVRSFDQLFRDSVYVNIKTADGLLVHIKGDRVVKYVLFLNPNTYPSIFQPDDLATIKAKIDELHAFAGLTPEAGQISAPYLKSLQTLYDAQSAKYKQFTASAAQQSNSEEERAAFDKKCELMRLDLVANRDEIKRSEEIVKQMEPLAPRSPLLTGVLATWNEEKKHAQELSSEGKSLWRDVLKAHPESFADVHDVKAIPDFPADFREKATDLFAKLEKFRTSVTYPQLLTYCQTEIPTYFLLTQLSKMVEKIKAGKYEETAALGQKTMTQVEERQIGEPYQQAYTTFKNYKTLVDDLRSRFLSQLAKLKQSESDFTDTELLGEYQKIYDLIPDPKVATRMDQLKAKIKAH